MAKKKTAKHTARRHSHRAGLSFLKQHRWWLIFAAIIIVEVCAQLWYPHRYTLPLARYNHEWYGVKHRNGLAIKEQRAFAAATVSLQLDDASVDVPLTKLGASLVEAKSFSTLHDYPLMWRFIPFSMFVRSPHVESLSVQFSEQSLRTYITQFAKKHYRAPTNATVRIEKGSIVATEAIPGRSIDETALYNALTMARYDITGSTAVTVPEKQLKPTATAADLAALREQAELTVARQLRITVAGRDTVVTPSREQLATWLQIGEENGVLQLQLNTKSVGRYIDELNKIVARPAGETVISIVDGQEAGRQEAAPGEEIDRGQFEERVRQLLFTPGRYKYMQAQLATIPARVKKKHSYTNSQAGLEAKLQEFGRRYNVRIAIRQLDGAKWHASYRGDESTPSASTYKLYVALRLFAEMDAGRTNWNAGMLDTTVAGCFDRMILHSTNQCAETWINQFGRSNINQFIRERGISEVTTFTSHDATRTSANDLLRVITGIYEGRLVNGPHREKLLDMLSRQIWRKGIPAGTKGWTSNKVGFLWDYVHDTGIVHHPRGTYAVAIMTKGANYGIIAQMIRELEAFMYP